MIIENFVVKVIKTKIFETYVATGFFAAVIFFIFNSHLYTPTEIILGVVLLTVALKAVTNMMLSLLILLFDYSSKEDEAKFKLEDERLNLLLSEMQMQTARMQTKEEQGKV